MKLIAFDPASNSCGYAIFDSEINCTEYGVVKTTISEIMQLIESVGDEFSIAVETQYMSFNAKSFAMLVKVRAIIETLAFLKGCKAIYEIPANSWQSIILKTDNKIKRKDRKLLSKVSASEFLNKEIKNDNIADAINIGRFILSVNNPNKFILKGGCLWATK